MNGGPSIVGLRAADTAQPFVADPPQEAAEAAAVVVDSPEEWVDEPPPRNTARLLVGGAALLAALLWVGWLVYAARGEIGTMAPLALAQFGAALAAVPALAGIVWLLALRTSRAEATRFNDTARAMRAEAQSLEQTVAILSGAIDDRRAALSEHVRLLTTLGDKATDRLATIGRNLSEEIDQADVHARALSESAGAATAGLDALLAEMPRASEQAQTLGGRIEVLGTQATHQIAAMEQQLAALVTRAGEAERAATTAAQRLADHLTRMEATSESAAARLGEVTNAAEQSVDALLERTAAAVDESRRGLVAQGDAMLAMVSANQTALDHAAREGASALATRIDIIEQVIERIADRLEAQAQVSHSLFEALEAGAAEADARIVALHRSGDARVQQLAASIAALTASTEAMSAALNSGDVAAKGAIATSETLLTALDAAAREMDETLPHSFARLDESAGATRRAVGAIKPELMSLVTAAESSHEAISAIAGVVAEQRRTVDALAATLLQSLSDGRAKADAIAHALDEAQERAERVGGEIAPMLLESLQRVRETAVAAADCSRETIAAIVPQVTEMLRTASTDALAQALDGSVEERIAALKRAAERAAAVSTQASATIDARVAELDSATGRAGEALARATEERDANERETFARRAGELIEALNSAAIDLTRGFAADVADTAWAAYLKGDRGVFTRRAVRAIDGSAEGEVLRLYEADVHFREQVNRYVHDFETMLRHILAERDGSALGVTLLSSDMGKLYVALAQAIQRLR